MVTKMSLHSLIDVSKLAGVNVAGQGGKETEISAILPGWRRVGGALHDYEIDDGGHVLRLEVKKQVNTQWFDAGKYHGLADGSRQIWMLFVVHKAGTVSHLLAARLGEFVDRLCSLPDFQKLGWNREAFAAMAQIKAAHPAAQAKIKADILSLYRTQPDLFDVLYDGSPTKASTCDVSDGESCPERKPDGHCASLGREKRWPRLRRRK
jgi:hypothetical protein